MLLGAFRFSLASQDITDISRRARGGTAHASKANVNRSGNRSANINRSANVNRNAAGAAIGGVTAATAVAWAGPPPGPDMCWYYTDPSQRQGFWDVCR